MPCTTLAQQPGKVWKIGYLILRQLDSDGSDYEYGPFKNRIRELGYIEGKHFVIDLKSAEGNAARIPALVADLVRAKVDVIVSAGTIASLAAQKATAEIPIVVVGAGDLVQNGLVKNLARPGGNITGISLMTPDFAPKLMNFAHDILPAASRIAVLMNPQNPGHALSLRGIRKAAENFRIDVLPAEAKSSREIVDSFELIERQKAGAVIVLREPFFQQQRRQIVELALKHRLLSIGTYVDFAEIGGVIGYGQALADGPMRAASYVDKIIKGAKPTDLPVEQPTRWDLAVNLKTARLLGVTIPPVILVQATKVIE